jgi:hypothetical protein
MAMARAAAAGGLGYVDSSLGLQTPAMEGGRTEVEFGDVNGDGHPDLVCIGDHGSPYINTSQHGVMVWFGDGAGGWRAIAITNTPDACDTAALRAGTDVDHNGYPDVAIVSEEDCQPFVGGANRPRVYVEGSIPSAPWVYPVSPRGGEVFIAGSVRFVDWHAAVPTGIGAPTMTIELSTAGPDGPWSPVAEGQPDNGRYQWVVPDGLPSSGGCHLRLTLDTLPPAIAVTPAAFAIVGSGPIPGDLDGDGSVSVADFVLLLAVWGPCPPPCPPSCPGDIDGDCAVGVNDFLLLLANWS